MSQRVKTQAEAHSQAEAQKRLTVTEAQRLLIMAEAADGFFAKVAASPVNTAARRLCSYTAWNDQSLAAVASAMLEKEDRWVDIVILDPSAEGGMPHTRPGLICLPAYYPESRLPETLRHEMIHISQKRQPSLWTSRANVEGWSAVRPEIIPLNWASRCRLNPDTAGTLYAWRGHVPLPVYVREDKPNLRDIEVRWFDIAEGIVRSTPTSFTQYYGKRGLGVSQAEHPYELWAYDN